MSKLAFRKLRRASRISLTHTSSVRADEAWICRYEARRAILTGVPRKWLKRRRRPRRSLMLSNKRRWRHLRILDGKASQLVSSFSRRDLERRGFPRLTAIGRISARSLCGPSRRNSEPSDRQFSTRQTECVHRTDECFAAGCDADLLFASVQTLGRIEHLGRFAPTAFDYIVIDEFHHAAATTYRRIIDYFQPKFLLGLTATPERMDGGDLLALCQENLVFEASVPDGISADLLCAFQYLGVPDVVDYANIPWRNARFDPTELTAAVATDARAQNALEQFRKHGAQRCIAFCCSQRHANFMAEFFNARGLRTVAVHAGNESAPRTTSLQQLASGELDVIFSVDMFNEGVDVPNIDTVLMLRPTESTVIWMQQFGRGLRRAPGKPFLKVIDYIGNHRSFLMKLRSVAALADRNASSMGALRSVLDEVRRQELELPEGCSVTYELESIEILESLLKPARPEAALEAFYRDFFERHGVRPTAVEAFHEGFNPRAQQ